MINKQIIQEDLENIYNSNIDWSKFFNTTVLITGASGFLPAYLVETLLFINSKNNNANIKIIGLVRNLDKAKKRFANYLDNSFLEFLVQDVISDIKVDSKIDYVIHAASQASPKYFGLDPVGTITANVIGTNNLLKLAYEKSVKKFLYFSSSEVYGQVPAELLPIKESDYGYIDPCNVRSCYSEGKRAGETICISWKSQFQVPIVIVRPFHTYGPGMELNDGRVYADFISNIINNQNIEMKSDGSSIRAFCYIKDATEAFFRVLLYGETGEAYNVGNDLGESSILELAELLVDMYPEKKLKVLKIDNTTIGYIASYVSRISPNVTKIKQIGWEPKTGIREGFFKTINSFKL